MHSEERGKPFAGEGNKLRDLTINDSYHSHFFNV